MRGLVAYDDESLSDESLVSDVRAFILPCFISVSLFARFPFSFGQGSKLNTSTTAPPDQPQRSTNTLAPSLKAGVIIRRHAPVKPRPRARLPEDEAGPSTPSAANPASQEFFVQSQPDSESSPEINRIRELLRPPPIPGTVDWEIPPEPETPCDEAIKTKIASFLHLKRDQQNPRHFNDSLMSNRAFRNPHLYAKLVEFVDVDERATNFPERIWNPMDVKEEWFADRIADAQKVRSEATATSQSSSKRSHIDFASTSAPKPPSVPNHARPIQADGNSSRFQPYTLPSRGAGASGERFLGGGYGQGRGKSRWG
ncbi:HCNGP-like protein-domain-containing protein [Trametes gibbosa]|nr:HCNGP-like protein-domain-containing protein [Trametes gibbosa]